MSDSIYEGAIRDQIARNSTDSKPQLKEFSSALFETLREGLLYDGHVRIHQFGSFKLKWSNERKGKHPKTGEPLIIPAQPRITFTAAKALKDRVNSEQADLPEQTVELHEAAISLPVTNPEIIDKPTGHAEVVDITAIEPADQALPQETRDQNQNKTTRMTAIAATVLCAAIIGYFINSPSQQPTVQTADTPAEPASHALASNISSPSITDTQITDRKTDTATETAIISDSSSSPVTEITDPVAAASTTQTAPFFSARRHRLVNGDSLWRLSRKSYTNPFYWPHIYQANRSGIRNPNKLRMGRTITLPSLHGSPDDLTAEDKRNIAEGYFQVYRYYKKTDKPFPYYALLGASKFDPAVIQDHIYEIDEQDWQSLQLASN